ncbi:hypothetical protein [Myroides sp. N17-2]|uniref:hypothetical protein n=1 Tax=Myroides sp. N17-2 TaxID=2030799 RepID=UPI000EFB798B|nr:hypothetical protein [Myroides sp. N17-2]
MMLGVDIPLTWINKQRNKKASEVESAKAEDEFTIQQKKTGGATLAALNTQIEVLNKDKITLTKTLEDTSKGLSENENTLAENSKIIYIKENKIRELEQQLISFNHPIGHNNIDEEISSFNDVLEFFIGNGGDKEDIHSTLRKISNEGNSTPLMVIQSWINYEDFIQKNIIIQKEINGIPYVELLPYGIKFMYWLEGFLSNNSVKDEGDGIEELNKEIDDIVEYSVSEKYNVEKIYNKFLELGIVDSYQKDMIMIKEEKPIPSNRLNFREYLRYDLIKVKKIGVAGARFYELTVLGESLFTYIVQKEL